MGEYREEMNQGYWEGFIRYMNEHFPNYRFNKPSKQGYQVVPPVLLTGVQIAVGMNRMPVESIRVDVTLTNTPEEWATQLWSQSEAIENEVAIADGTWEWKPRPGKAETHIILRKHVSLDGAREPQYAWLAKAAVRFHEVFGPRVATFT